MHQDGVHWLVRPYFGPQDALLESISESWKMTLEKATTNQFLDMTSILPPREVFQRRVHRAYTEESPK